MESGPCSDGQISKNLKLKNVEDVSLTRAYKELMLRFKF